MKATKSEVLHVRITSQNKRILEGWAKQREVSVADVIHKMVIWAKIDEIGVKAREFAHKETAKLFSIPEKMVIGIITSQEWKEFKEFLGEEKFNAYHAKWYEINMDEQDRLAEEEGVNIYDGYAPTE